MKTLSTNMEKSGWKTFITASLLALSLLVSIVIAGSQSQGTRLQDEPACQVLTPSAAGGPMPKDPSVIVLRWLGVTNFELATRDVVILTDAYYERPAGMHPIGVKREDLKKVNAILVGHGHSDHISDADYIARRTGAMVVGGPPSAEYLEKTGLSPKQITLVKGGETFEFNGFKVRAILGHHNTIPQEYQANIMEARRLLGNAAPLTEEEKRLNAEINKRGTSDPRISDIGTIGYYFEFDSGYRMMYVDSPGPITPAQKEMMTRIPSIDLGILPYTGGDMAVELTMEFVRLFKPGIVIPGHHDMFPGKLDMPTIPLFTAIRDEFPKTKTVAPLYRTPVCVNTVTKEVFVGQ